MIDVRDNWRILLLVVLCIVAAFALFGPLGADEGGIEFDEGEETTFEQDIQEEEQRFSDPTNLQYGLELSGGTRVRGVLIGLLAEDLPIDEDDGSDVERELAAALELEGIDVQVTQRTADTADVEVFSRNVTEAEFADALTAVGVEADEGDVREGTTADTRETALDVLQDRIDGTGLGGASVTQVSAATGGHFLVVEVPGADRETVEQLIGEPGRVQIVAGYPVQGENGTELRTEEVLTEDDFTNISPARDADEQNPQPNVPLSLTDDAAERYAQVMQDGGFTGQGVGQCDFNATEHDDFREDQWCLYTVVDDEIVYGASMGSSLAESIESSGFLTDPSFIMQTQTLDEARQLEINLQSGALPTELDIRSSSFISPSLAELFKPLALATGIAAWLTVAVVCYVWYRDVRVAVPMFLTASTEVFLLLGFAAAIGMALDLSHIAGFIAVIGTGLDDLIIMADEILQRKQDVNTGRVFQSRFRKAFWIIGMAAATTIVAMSPLAVLSLGDLQGFAIITIVGVLIGVGITRPAYGDVLRKLMLDDVKRK